MIVVFSSLMMGWHRGKWKMEKINWRRKDLGISLTDGWLLDMGSEIIRSGLLRRVPDKLPIYLRGSYIVCSQIAGGQASKWESFTRSYRCHPWITMICASHNEDKVRNGTILLQKRTAWHK